MNNDIGDKWLQLQSQMDEDQQDEFIDELSNMGFHQFEATDDACDLAIWISEQQGFPITVFHDPEDGAYFYAYRGSSDETASAMELAAERSKNNIVDRD